MRNSPQRRSMGATAPDSSTRNNAQSDCGLIVGSREETQTDNDMHPLSTGRVCPSASRTRVIEFEPLTEEEARACESSELFFQFSAVMVLAVVLVGLISEVFRG